MLAYMHQVGDKAYLSRSNQYKIYRTSTRTCFWSYYLTIMCTYWHQLAMYSKINYSI